MSRGMVLAIASTLCEGEDADVQVTVVQGTSLQCLLVFLSRERCFGLWNTRSTNFVLVADKLTTWT